MLDHNSLDGSTVLVVGTPLMVSCHKVVTSYSVLHWRDVGCGVTHTYFLGMGEGTGIVEPE